MAELYDSNSVCLGDLPVSPQNWDKLLAGEAISIPFHTPRKFLAMLGPRNGMLELTAVDGRLVVTNPEAFKRYLQLQADIIEAEKDA